MCSGITLTPCGIYGLLSYDLDDRNDGIVEGVLFVPGIVFIILGFKKTAFNEYKG
jgi:hypothetical protein